HYHVISKDQVMRAVSGQETSLLVIPQWIIEYYHDLSAREIDQFHEAVDANYSLITEIRGVAIYRRRAHTDEQTSTGPKQPHGALLNVPDREWSGTGGSSNCVHLSIIGLSVV